MPRSPGQGSLFERLDPELPPRRTRSRQDLATERIRAVKRHLDQILNTRRGSSQSCPGLGLPDLNDATIGSNDLRVRICRDIRAAVAAFEPRVQVLQVQPVTDSGRPLELHFRLHCLIPVNNIEEQVEIDLIVGRHDQSTLVV
ncbi:type VI secretion system baseplate subunit TssE [Cupriavidus sp. 30B13]|uniref:type VI secretion system baseplate subunit TssE n=1 Tax=Cupriavidus sp. 30B13 TaxID=3384241 RepID=UPI003B90141C